MKTSETERYDEVTQTSTRDTDNMMHLQDEKVISVRIIILTVGSTDKVKCEGEMPCC